MGNFYYLVGVEVEADYRIVAFGMLRFLFDREAVAILVEFGYAVAFRIVDPVAEDGCFILLLSCLDSILQDFGETCTVEYIVAEDETG